MGRAFLRFGATSAFSGDPRAYILLRIGPDTATVPQALDQTAIVCAQDTDAMRAKPCLSHQALKFGKEFLAHADNITRYSVHVNTRYNVRAKPATAC